MKLISRFLSTLVLLCVASTGYTWDGTGHRLTAAVALNYVDAETRLQLLTILAAHPRYREDFLGAIPNFIDRDDADELAQWLLGQAAYWPDIARGLPDADRRRYNRPTWHYIDGAWVRDQADQQGNVYVGITAFADVTGTPASAIRSEEDVDNVVTALDYNTRLLADNSRPLDERAVALCWVLHLMGDIHQPLHTGSLFSANLFASGDRGGNAIAIEDSNLHAVWDQAMRAEGFLASLPPILQTLEPQPPAAADNSDWTGWMAESREILQAQVYTDAMLEAISRADRLDTALPTQSLSADYEQEMDRISQVRLGLSGYRLAQWFNRTLTD